MKTPSRYCAKGEQCSQYAALGEPQKLREKSESSICEACRRAEREAESEKADRTAPTGARGKRKTPDRAARGRTGDTLPSDAKRWIRNFKGELVISLFMTHGPFWKAVSEVRALGHHTQSRAPAVYSPTPSRASTTPSWISATPSGVPSPSRRSARLLRGREG